MFGELLDDYEIGDYVLDFLGLEVLNWKPTDGWIDDDFAQESILGNFGATNIIFLSFFLLFVLLLGLLTIIFNRFDSQKWK